MIGCSRNLYNFWLSKCYDWSKYMVCLRWHLFRWRFCQACIFFDRFVIFLNSPMACREIRHSNPTIIRKSDYASWISDKTAYFRNLSAMQDDQIVINILSITLYDYQTFVVRTAQHFFILDKCLTMPNFNDFKSTLRFFKCFNGFLDNKNCFDA